MWRFLKKYLEKIQNSDEATKKRWLVAATAVSMIIVIGFWFVYINYTTKPAVENTAVQTPNIGFWQIFKNGLAVIYQSLKEKVQIIFSEITKSRTINVE